MSAEGREPTPDPRRGAVAAIDGAKIMRALKIPVNGEVISLNLPLDDPHTPANRPSFKRGVRQHNQLRPLGDGRFVVVNDDQVEIALQGSSQWDALAHVGFIEEGSDEVYYGGTPLSETFPEPIAHEYGLHALGPAIITRGVLIDLVRSLDPDLGYLDNDRRVDLAEVEAAIASQGIEVEPGDAVLLYTGFQRRRRALGGEYPLDIAGLDGSSVEFWQRLKIGALIADNQAVEANPADFSIHKGILRDAGIPLGELWALEELAEACAGDGRYEFLLASVPLNIHGAFGSPANAVAVR